jgi:hypothetical protein
MREGRGACIAGGASSVPPVEASPAGLKGDRGLPSIMAVWHWGKRDGDSGALRPRQLRRAERARSMKESPTQRHPKHAAQYSAFRERGRLISPNRSLYLAISNLRFSTRSRACLLTNVLYLPLINTCMPASSFVHLSPPMHASMVPLDPTGMFSFFP